jgi:hypothetical protein
VAVSGRVYNIGGMELPSVTTILDTLNKGEGIQNWAVECALDYIRDNSNDDYPLDELLASAKDNWRVVLNEAANIGSEVHDMIQEYIATGNEDSEYRHPSVRQSFGAFLKWQEQHGVKWIRSEMQVASKRYGYAGTLDGICIYEGRRIVVDFKTASGFWDTYRMQAAAYRQAALESGEDVDGHAILRLDKEDGRPEFKDYSPRYERDLNTFLKLTELYYLLKDRRLANNPFLLAKEKPIKTQKLGGTATPKTQGDLKNASTINA